MSGGYEVPLLRPVSGTLDVVVEDALPEGGQYREAADEPEEPEQDDDDGLLADGGVDFVAILHALATPQSALTIKPRVMCVRAGGREGRGVERGGTALTAAAAGFSRAMCPVSWPRSW